MEEREVPSHRKQMARGPNSNISNIEINGAINDFHGTFAPLKRHQFWEDQFASRTCLSLLYQQYYALGNGAIHITTGGGIHPVQNVSLVSAFQALICHSTFSNGLILLNRTSSQNS